MESKSKLFDELVKAIPKETDRGDVIDACDSAYLAKRWFETYEISYTAADVVALASLIIRPKIARMLARDEDDSPTYDIGRIADALESTLELFTEATGHTDSGKRFLRNADLNSG